MMEAKNKLISSFLCLALVFSVCSTSVYAAVLNDGKESGSTYLVKSGQWNSCAGFTAEKDGIKFSLTANDTNTLDYNVQLCEGKVGKGVPIESCFNIPIGTAITFEGLVAGEDYYFAISSDTVIGSGIGAVYELSNFDAKYKGDYTNGYGVKFYYNNGESVSVGIYLNINGLFTIVDAPKYTGHTFGGWSCGGTVYQPGEVVNVSQDMRFDAVWTESVPPRNPFVDVNQDDVYFNAVIYVYEKGIMAGTSATMFSPNDPVTRAAVWTVLARMSGVDTNGGNTWYEKAQKWAISTGISDGSNPEQIVSHQELITMLYRYAGSPPVKDPENYATAFGDMKDIAGWAYNSVIWATQNDLLNIYYSSGMLHPTQVSLRWELACILAQYDMKIA